MQPFDYSPRIRVVSGPGSIGELGELMRELGFARPLLVADPYIANPPIECPVFRDFDPNPDSAMVERGRIFAAGIKPDSIIAMGGGSALDCAKGINFVHTNGGAMKDYWGHNKATRPMLPMIGIPTTTGTGSEAQSYALIADAETHVKMACGDDKAAFRVTILDPELAVTQPMGVRATAGYDAISHAVEAFVTAKGNAISDCFSREAWRLLDSSFERILRGDDVDAFAAMQLGSHFAGAAIEASMLGATHACANPLTARFGITHGVAIGALLPHVVRWNGLERYRELHADLTARLTDLAHAAGLGKPLREYGVPESALPQLAADAAQQWTGKFNPRPFDAMGALEIYKCAY